MAKHRHTTRRRRVPREANSRVLGPMVRPQSGARNFTLLLPSRPAPFMFTVDDIRAARERAEARGHGPGEL
jgi:hypothetical protein